MASLAKQFMERFAGLMRAHGCYAVGNDLTADANGKQTGSRGTRPNEHFPDGTVTLQLWEEHLAGKIGIGIVPIRDDATVKFAAGDIDEYKVPCISCNGVEGGCEKCEKRGWNPLDLVDLQRKIIKLDLPLLVTRTKSGGAHLYVFFEKPVPAALAVAKLLEWVIALGYPKIEIFPKQVKLAQRADGSSVDTGNWINMPYQGGEDTNRYGIKPDGTPLSPKEYLKLAEKMAVPDEEHLAAIELPDVDEDWLDAPPCLQVLAAQGFSEGARNNALFNVAVYLRKRYDEGWLNYLNGYNVNYFSPPLAQREVSTLGKSVNKKSYNYKCRDMPIVSVCNRAVCLTRACGVGNAADDPGVVFGDLVKLKTDPVTWIWDVNGARLELGTAELRDQRKFQDRCIEVLSILPNTIKPGTWNEMIRDKLEKAENIEVPTDATREGQLWGHLADFCTSKVQGKALDEIMMGKPFTDDKKGRTYFRGADFMQYLTQHRVPNVTERDLWRWLKRMKADHHSQTLKGKGCNFWSVPAFEKQTEDFAIPRTPQESM